MGYDGNLACCERRGSLGGRVAGCLGTILSCIFGCRTRGLLAKGGSARS